MSLTFYYCFSIDDDSDIFKFKPMWPKRHSVLENIPPRDQHEDRGNISQKARKLMQPLKHNIHLQKIMPYNWNSIFKDEEVPKKKISKEFLDDPHGFIKGLCFPEQTISSAQSSPDLEEQTLSGNLINGSFSDLSLFDEIFTELGNTLPRHCDQKPNLSDVEMENSENEQARYSAWWIETKLQYFH